MKIPHTISKRVLKTYKTPNVFIRQGKIQADNLKWKEGKVARLKDLCLQTIATNWKKFPFYNEFTIPENKSNLVELISTDLPIELSIPIIDSEFFWKRTYEAHWPNSSPPFMQYKYEKLRPFFSDSDISSTEDLVCTKILDMSIETIKPVKIAEEDINSVPDRYFKLNGYKKYSPSLDSIATIDLPDNIVITKTWKQCFIERYFAEAIQAMTPDIFHEEYIQKLTSLFKDYIISLTLTHLQCCKNKAHTDHISIKTILEDLPYLIELSVCFNQGNVLDQFTWHCLEISEADCLNMGKGMQKSNLEILRILHTTLEWGKFRLLLRSLEYHHSLRILDFSYCRICDKGALAIVAVLMKNPLIDTLILANNNIGERGAQGIGFYFCSTPSRLIKLNLKFNPLGVNGGRYIGTAIARGARSLRFLSIAGCGLTEENYAFGLALSVNDTLQNLDLSNNRLGETAGQILVEKLRYNDALIRIDVRECNIRPELVKEINRIVHSNLSKYRKQPLKTTPCVQNII